ncbi:MAG TPA: DUF4350 domain-containing protein [Solirubrobacteraceae bacterium]|nr:DUF4350 domain-containing protein [Solirubrobacteraceae bacterium]
MRELLPRSAAGRFALGAVVFLVAINVAALLIDSVRPQPSGEDASAYATQPQGVAAYAELLGRTGHPVRYLRDPLDEARLDPRATVVVLDAPGIEGGERAALRRFLRRGGRLVAGGEDAGRGIVARAPEWTPDGRRLARPTNPVPETRGVRLVSSDGGGGFAALGGAVGALGEREVLLAVARAGRGRALLLADSSPLHNRLLANTDNAALGLALAGPPRRPVVFAESIHGFGQASGLAAIPARWRFALAIAGLASLLWLLSQARRLGPAEEDAADPVPARLDHVNALALALRGVEDREAAIAPVRAAARAGVLGYGEDEIVALVGDDGTGRDRASTRGRR